MEYTHLGRTGLLVSKICLGTMAFGNNCDEKESCRIMDAALDAGINFFDSADNYGKATNNEGITEKIIGRWFKQGGGRRERVVLTTKVHYHHIVRDLFGTLFLLLLRNYSGTAKNSPYINTQLGCISPAIAYIAENYMEEVSIEKLSHLCHVSTSHFRRLFKQVLGWSPLDYVQMVRIDRACVLLYNCDYSVTEIGLQVGYPSPSSFNRQFRRIHGISPSQWRQKMRSEENPMVTAYFNSLPPSNFQFFPVEYHSLTK